MKPYFDSFITLGLPQKRIKKMSLTSQELFDVFKQLVEIDKKEFNIDTPIYKNMRTYGRRPCKKSTKLSIRLDGKVYPCISRTKKPL